MRRSMAIFIAVALAAVESACHLSGASPSAPGPPATNATTSALLPRSVTGLPSFDFDAYERLLFQLRGTPVVVNLWASWCGPCRTETPVLVEAARRYGDRVQFLGVAYHDQRGPAASFLKQFSVPYPSLFDASGEIHDKLGFVGLPDTVFYGADGSIVAIWSGPLTAETLRRDLDREMPE